MIKGNRLNLMPICADDLEWLRTVRNQYKEHFFDSGEISSEQQRIWYRHYQESHVDQMFIVELKGGDRIGTIALYNIDLGNRTATLGRVLLLEEYRGSGYAEEFLNLLLDMAFNVMRLYKVKVEVHLENINAIAIYARAGFKTMTKPIMLLEKVNPHYDSKKPIRVSSYDDLSGDGGYEGQNTNIK